jgi:hypothetical protein
MHALFEDPLHCILQHLRKKVYRLLHSFFTKISIDLHRNFLLPNEYVKISVIPENIQQLLA